MPVTPDLISIRNLVYLSSGNRFLHNLSAGELLMRRNQQSNKQADGRPIPGGSVGEGGAEREPWGLQYPATAAAEIYYLQEGRTRTGKPKYYTGRKVTGTAIDALPAGYEIHESPEHGQVVVRKSQPSTITADERETVAQAVRRSSGIEHIMVEIEGDSLVVWVPSMDVSEAVTAIHDLAGAVSPVKAREFRELLLKQSHYQEDASVRSCQIGPQSLRCRTLVFSWLDRRLDSHRRIRGRSPGWSRNMPNTWERKASTN